MKTKKILSVLLAVVFLFSAVAVNVYAADELVYTATGKYTIEADHTLDPDTFAITTIIDNSKIAVLEGGTSEYTYEIVSFTANYADLSNSAHTGDYIEDPEAFFAVFAQKEADIEYADAYNKEHEDNENVQPLEVGVIYLECAIEITFVDTKIFGDLDYVIQIDGFSAPLSTGIDFADGAISGAKLPVDITIEGNIAEFPAIASTMVLSTPVKTDYYDSEKFDPTGLSLAVSTTAGAVGIYTYNEETAHSFSFNPTNKEKLTTYDSEVVTYLNGLVVLKTPITVNHKWSDSHVCITTYKVTDTKPGYHAIVCEGCGETHDAQPHVYSSDSWVYNEDQTFLKNGTQSTTCEVCGAVVTRDCPGTADYITALGDYHFIRVILDYVNMLLSIISGATA